MIAIATAGGPLVGIKAVGAGGWSAQPTAGRVLGLVLGTSLAKDVVILAQCECKKPNVMKKKKDKAALLLQGPNKTRYGGA